MNGAYGVTVLTDCKYGSDKPDDQTLRLTLLRTPAPVALAGPEHPGLGPARHPVWAGRTHGRLASRPNRLAGTALNQPLLAFQTVPHPGALGRSLSLLSLNTDRVRVLRFYEFSDARRRLPGADQLPASAATAMCWARNASGVLLASAEYGRSPLQSAPSLQHCTR